MLDFVVYFRVDLHRIPVFFVEVKTALTITILSARADADDQMRQRLRQLYDQSLSELRGISALGTKLCFYSLDKSLESLTPLAIPRNEAYINDTAPVARWDSDILGMTASWEFVTKLRLLLLLRVCWHLVHSNKSRYFRLYG